MKGKKVAVVGTGASGVQIAQEWGPQVESLTVYQRTPNLALPMGRRSMSAAEQEALKAYYPEIMDLRERCFAGFTYDFSEKDTWDDTPEEREAFWERYVRNFPCLFAKFPRNRPRETLLWSL